MYYLLLVFSVLHYCTVNHQQNYCNLIRFSIYSGTHVDVEIHLGNMFLIIVFDHLSLINSPFYNMPHHHSATVAKWVGLEDIMLR